MDRKVKKIRQCKIQKQKEKGFVCAVEPLDCVAATSL